jgi:hypothetical protein
MNISQFSPGPGATLWIHLDSANLDQVQDLINSRVDEQLVEPTRPDQHFAARELAAIALRSCRPQAWADRPREPTA